MDIELNNHINLKSRVVQRAELNTLDSNVEQENETPSNACGVETYTAVAGIHQPQHDQKSNFIFFNFESFPWVFIRPPVVIGFKDKNKN